MTITILVSFSHHPRRSPAYGTSEASEGSAGDDDTRMMIEWSSGAVIGNGLSQFFSLHYLIRSASYYYYSYS